MESLSASRLLKVHRASALATEFRELGEFRTGVISIVRELVPCESASYNEISPDKGVIVQADPADWLTPESLDVFARFSNENPLIAHHARTGDGRPVCLSDFISRRELHKLTLYDQLYRPLKIEHQIALVLPSPPGEVVGIALNRERHDFTSEEAAMLELLRRPLRACYARLMERDRLTSLLLAYAGGEEIAQRATALGLSERELEVMQGVIGGSSNAETAISLGISRRTVEKHLQNVYARLGVTSRTQAIGRLREGSC
jgi:DNA-binding CsgD family transcriptional regulator